MSLKEFTINIAQSIRAYGSVTVEANNLDEALAKIDGDYVYNHFEPHGSGDDDFEYRNAKEIWLCDGFCEDLETGEESDFEVDKTLPDTLAETGQFVLSKDEVVDLLGVLSARCPTPELRDLYKRMHGEWQECVK